MTALARIDVVDHQLNLHVVIFVWLKMRQETMNVPYSNNMFCMESIQIAYVMHVLALTIHRLVKRYLIEIKHACLRLSSSPPLFPPPRPVPKPSILALRLFVSTELKSL